jgi:hypothetical protein
VSVTVAVVPSDQIAYSFHFLGARGKGCASDTTVGYAIRCVTRRFVEKRWGKGCAVSDPVCNVGFREMDSCTPHGTRICRSLFS